MAMKIYNIVWKKYSVLACASFYSRNEISGWYSFSIRSMYDFNFPIWLPIPLGQLHNYYCISFPRVGDQRMIAWRRSCLCSLDELERKREWERLPLRYLSLLAWHSNMAGLFRLRLYNYTLSDFSERKIMVKSSLQVLKVYVNLCVFISGSWSSMELISPAITNNWYGWSGP